MLHILSSVYRDAISKMVLGCILNFHMRLLKEQSNQLLKIVLFF